MTRQRSDEQRKRQIRAAATRCFVRKGYASTRLLDIAREAGLSKGGVYFHYRAKEQLFHDIIDTHLQTLHERWGFEPAADRPAADTNPAPHSPCAACTGVSALVNSVSRH